MPNNLLIVESPAKAKTIAKYLGDQFQVMASVGHIYDLPHSRLGVDLDNDFQPEYVAIAGKEKIIGALKKAAKNKSVIYLAPDPDREGEAIAWHIAQILGPKFQFKRVLFHELTQKAIMAALAEPTELSQPRFESQQTRRILDRLMGYLISPLLWKKLKRSLSAGRVQSVALRLIVERERAIFAFRPREYWTLGAQFLEAELPFEAQLVKRWEEKIELVNEEQTEEVIKNVTGQDFTVKTLVAKERKRTPAPPFTTSSLQQNAYNRLRLSSSRAMRLAQDLYEGMELPEGLVGLITYMRTDSVRLSDQAAQEARSFIAQNYGPENVPEEINRYRNKKGAQDAHEAIRPTSTFRTPEKLKNHLDNQHWQLYNLIWRRFVASQMSPALLEQTTVELAAGDYIFRATGAAIKRKGFLTVYDSGAEEEKTILPPLKEGQTLTPEKLNPKRHFTQPPPRFNEGTLVKELEEKGIGRPSTYASIISVLKDKEYTNSQKGVLEPTEMGFAVNDLLVDNFPKLMDVDFTAGLEENLDQIEEGEANRLEILQKMYSPLAASLETASQNMLNFRLEGQKVDLACPACAAPDTLAIRYGRNGFYLACSACGLTRDYVRDAQGQPQPVEPLTLATETVCEKCGQPMVTKKSRFGTFLACSAYPKCRNTKPLIINQNGLAEVPDDPPPAWPEDLSTVCEKCGGTMVPKKTRRGAWFIACDKYPKCSNAKSYPTGFKCPKPGCDGNIVEKRSKRGLFYACSNYPTCRVVIKGRPVAQKCPDCGLDYMVASSQDETSLTCPNLACPSKPKKIALEAKPRVNQGGGAKRVIPALRLVKDGQVAPTKDNKAAKALKAPKVPKATKKSAAPAKPRIKKTSPQPDPRPAASQASHQDHLGHEGHEDI
ncbi:MAG: type I DNA topoisomerase [Deltaproteobacteria bacterium]|jgi:DNA topoisomerase-1|nr:type I DNA topoisomerase [Deltaproteobacteria bacterium]